MSAWPVSLMAIPTLSVSLVLLSLHLVSTGLVGHGDCFEKLKNLGENDFRLKCTSNGFYEQVQCDNRTGYCFCVNERTGVHEQESQLMPIQDRRRFDCSLKVKREHDDDDHNQGDDRHNTKRNPKNRDQVLNRGSFPFAAMQEPLSSLPSSLERPRRLRGCRIGLRVSFLANLIGLLRRERQHLQQQVRQTSNIFIPGIRSRPSPRTSTPSSEDDVTIMKAKFHQLDADGDDRLVPEELGVYLQRIMANVTANGQSQYSDCARSLFAFCDPDRDQRVDEHEFAACLNISNSKRLNRKWNANRRLLQQNRRKDVVASEPWSPGPSSPSLSSPRFTLPVPEFNLADRATSSKDNKRRRLGPDCQSLRSDAIEMSESSSSSGPTHFIPNCTSDGYYQPIQCHNAATCWCVSKNAGTPLKRYTENSARTQALCERIRKGCNQQRRRAFHINFRQVLTSRKLSCAAAFAWIDTDGSGVMVRTEWLDFERQWWSKWSETMPINRSGGSERLKRRTEKCFRTEVSFCDEDGDEQLSRDEWLGCCERESLVNSSKLNVDGQGRLGRHSASIASLGSVSRLPETLTTAAIERRRGGPNKSRSGPNPFLTILRPD